MLHVLCAFVFEHGEVTIQTKIISPGAGTVRDRLKDNDTMWLFAGLEHRQPHPTNAAEEAPPLYIPWFLYLI